MREDDDRRRPGHLVEVGLQPDALLLPHHERRAVRVVEAGHLEHPLLGGRPPVVGPLVVGEDAVQHDEVHALVVEAVVVRPEELRPVLAEVEVVVVLAHHAVERVVELREHLRAVVELLLHAELAEVAAEHHEVRLRVEEVRLRHRPDEAPVPVAHEPGAGDVLDVGVGDVGEGEVQGGIAEGELHRAHRHDAGGGGRRRRGAGSRAASGGSGSRWGSWLHLHAAPRSGARRTRGS